MTLSELILKLSVGRTTTEVIRTAQIAGLEFDALYDGNPHFSSVAEAREQYIIGTLRSKYRPIDLIESDDGGLAI